MGGIRAWADKIGIGEATLHRIITGSADIRVDSIAAVAKGFGLEPWQLLVPDLDPANPPINPSPTERQFYASMRSSGLVLRSDT